MLNNRKIIRNAGWLAISEGVGTVLLSVAGFLLLTTWGSGQLGKLGVITAYVAMVAFIFDFGLPALVTQRLAKDPSETHKLIGNAVTLKIIVTALGFTLLAIALSIDLRMQAQWPLVAVWAMGVAASSFTNLWYSIARAFEEMALEAIGKVTNILLQASIVIGILVSREGVAPYVYAISVMMVLHAFVVGFYITKRYSSRLHVGFDAGYIRTLAVHALPLILSSVFATLYFSIDSLMLDRWYGEQVVGEYTAGYRIVLLLLTFLNLGYSALFPAMSRLFETDTERLGALLSNAVRVMFTLIVPFVVAVSLQSAQVLGLLHSSYVPGAAALSVLIWTVAANAISMACSFPLIARGDRFEYMYGLAFGAGFNVLANLFLIPLLSAQGAAIATLAADCILITYYWSRVHRKLPTFRLAQGVWPTALASVCMAITIVLISSLQLHVIISSAIGWCVYMAFVWGIGGLRTEDVRLVVSSFKRSST